MRKPQWGGPGVVMGSPVRTEAPGPAPPRAPRRPRRPHLPHLAPHTPERHQEPRPSRLAGPFPSDGAGTSKSPSGARVKGQA